MLLPVGATNAPQTQPPRRTRFASFFYNQEARSMDRRNFNDQEECDKFAQTINEAGVPSIEVEVVRD